MNIKEFKLKIEEAKIDQPIWFALESDMRPVDKDIKLCQKKLNVKLPEDYICFLHEFGGGDFAFTNVFF